MKTMSDFNYMKISSGLIFVNTNLPYSMSQEIVNSKSKQYLINRSIYYLQLIVEEYHSLQRSPLAAKSALSHAILVIFSKLLFLACQESIMKRLKCVYAYLRN